ncbi:5-formyltetrahydrofolate cyclo-ligase [Bremerella sp. T1]|uniref:5-formyltetrahydrofolate cyclo-ligase n=1 Tax=Bremerella sp. TYQ1 TaxID=3119568 RepID=UPI001CCF2092|nr:5-formyltetrahydrofolate cyclo-ligase [Bremerella volcania]UBM35133.1 5-formyltetrahydrofolate cyclo-ligase [Bremerella volcania]
MSPQAHPPANEKAAIRRDAIARRQSLSDLAERSLEIQRRFMAEFPWATGAMPLVYVHVRQEVETKRIIEDALHTIGHVAVPYCLPDNRLGLFQLKSEIELVAGAFGILEPREVLRKDRVVDPQTLDCLVMPGVAFDENGNRIGYGKGYFDRLLADVRPDCRKIGLAFDCQIYPNVPAESHDIPVDLLVTETRTIDCRGTT